MVELRSHFDQNMKNVAITASYLAILTAFTYCLFSAAATPWYLVVCLVLLFVYALLVYLDVSVWRA